MKITPCRPPSKTKTAFTSTVFETYLKDNVSLPAADAIKQLKHNEQRSTLDARRSTLDARHHTSIDSTVYSYRRYYTRLVTGTLQTTIANATVVQMQFYLVTLINARI